MMARPKRPRAICRSRLGSPPPRAFKAAKEADETAAMTNVVQGDRTKAATKTGSTNRTSMRTAGV